MVFLLCKLRVFLLQVLCFGILWGHRFRIKAVPMWSWYLVQKCLCLLYGTQTYKGGCTANYSVKKAEREREREVLFMIEVDRNCIQQGSIIIHNVSSTLFYCLILLFNSSCICMILDFLKLTVCAFCDSIWCRFSYFHNFLKKALQY